MSDDALDTNDDDFEDTGEVEEEGGIRGAKKIALFVIVPLLVISGVGLGLYASGVLDKFLKGSETEEVAEASDSKNGGPITFDAVFLAIPDIVVNLKTRNNQQRFLRLRVQLELASQAEKDAVETVMPRVVDQFQTYLREMRIQDLEGSAGIYRLQKELIARVNAAAYPIEVQDVLFQEMLIQ